MKVAIVISAVLGLSASTALAECAAQHTNTQASLSVDREQTTASITTAASPQDQAMLKKQGDATENQPTVTE